MAAEQGLFRETALDQLSSPEQLDRLLKITSPKGWVSLLAIWALLSAVIVWAFTGTVYTREPARGIIVTTGGIQLVNAPSEGRLSEILVGADDLVEVGQLVARIDKHQLMDEIKTAESLLALLKAEHEELDRLATEERAIGREVSQAEREVLTEKIRSAEEGQKRLEMRRSLVEEQVNKGMMATIELHRVEDELEVTLNTIKDSQLQINQVEARERNAEFAMQRESRTRTLARESAERRLEMLHSQLDRESQVRSAYRGRVVEFRKALFDVVGAGDPVLVLEPTDAKLEAILFVSAETGPKIQEGFDVDLNPSTVKQEEFGFLRGKVVMRSKLPTSKAAMLAALKDVDLVEQFTSEVGLPLEMRVELIEDASTATGFAWSSGDGPQRRITAGTLCSATVKVRAQRPISLVIPHLGRLDDAG
jgi:HlyD family secretion protein